ncbi:MAG: glycosyltransferase family 4 protein [Patescibacteria group bacterium]
MKILAIHKHYFYRDGASTYFLDVNALMESYGHTVVPFAMKGDHNLPTPYEKYFVDELDLRANRTLLDTVQKAKRVVWNSQAARQLDELIAEEGPFDVAHVHNIYHHLTPAILHVLVKHHIPVLMTLHDYKLVDANYALVIPRSFTEKVGGMVERVVHQIARSYARGVTLFHAPSKFMQEYCVRAGWPRARFVRFPYVVDVAAIPFTPGGDGSVLYAGRLSHEKGVELLIRAVALVPTCRLVIAGTGPLEASLRSLVREHALDDRVIFVGHLSKDALRQEMTQASIVAVPSQWPENYPLAVLEAQAMGKMVIAARAGGIPEQIKHGVTGFLVHESTPEAWAAAIAHVQALKPRQVQAIGDEARAWVTLYHAPVVHYGRLLMAYQQAIQNAVK